MKGQRFISARSPSRPKPALHLSGTERVVVSQLHRSPGVFFEHDKGKTHASGKLLYSARMIPYRGSWLDFEFDPKDIVFVRIDRRRKMAATVLIKALGFSVEDVVNFFYKSERITYDGRHIFKSVVPEVLAFQRSAREIKNPKSDEVIIRKGQKFGRVALEKLATAKLKEIPVELEEILGRVAAHDVVDKDTGEIILECNEVITEEKWEEIRKRKIDHVDLLYIDNLNVGAYIRNTLATDKV